jgi:hypothetical protein
MVIVLQQIRPDQSGDEHVRVPETLFAGETIG